MQVALRPNDRWSLDFVSDQLTDGRRFRILTIVDDCTRENIALIADTSLSGLRVATELDRLVTTRGKPRMIVSDNGTEFTSNAILVSLRGRPPCWVTSFRPRSPQADPALMPAVLLEVGPWIWMKNTSAVAVGAMMRNG